ncbi:type I-C CRISPR-associated protein Cas7/Csd2 [Pelagicoccus sp. NFK12]|uniref:Type I-C CRISPR-associated protein Cas7/Csd2 n=1 Tax=Pelagicoccus enzymogenes TaxID=2773457 RepID=A0A927F860_9BACT|nr:type I-C CRISPR-associated protein Cas7/Csd2 [Pelagicoccus enzymogenes]MBD5779016.1 type I-C CRISPR-associated protein Cas7/Csd2 [Pelagicoccus enzymogenes]
MQNRYDFLFLFDCQDANPNGDPDAGNLPRLDVETGQGLVTDVCLKRKIRNFVDQTTDKRIYFVEGAVHNNQHKEAYEAIGEKPEKKVKPEIKDKATAWMCENYFDVRTFGAVMSTEVNCGQVRGPIQLSFARSIDPVVSSEHAITRTSVTNEKDIEKERTMGRKFTVPYGLYLAKGFVNPFLAKQTGFSDEDLELLLTALENAFQFDQSAARPAGSMNPRGLLVFKHSSQLGNAPSHKLFEAVSIKKSERVEVPRSHRDYEAVIDVSKIPEGVEVIKRIWAFDEALVSA